MRKVPSGTPRYQNENNTSKKKDEPSTNVILSAKEQLHTLINGRVNLEKTTHCGLIVKPRHKAGQVRKALGMDGNERDEKELDMEEGP